MELADGRLRIEVADGTARLVLNNPKKLNAVSIGMWRAFPEAVAALQEDESVRVVVMEGAGDRAFSVGNDISEFGEYRDDAAAATDFDAMAWEAYEAIRGLDKPLIAKVRGYCIGGGLELSQLCDLQVAADTARFAVTPARLGLGYKLEDLRLLLENIPKKHVKELLFTGRHFTAIEALGMGIVNCVVTEAKLDDHVAELCAEIAGNAPLSVKAAKRIAEEAVKEESARDLALCKALVEACRTSEDLQEGRRAFAEKRRPRFKGR